MVSRYEAGQSLSVDSFSAHSCRVQFHRGNVEFCGMLHVFFNVAQAVEHAIFLPHTKFNLSLAVMHNMDIYTPDQLKSSMQQVMLHYLRTRSHMLSGVLCFLDYRVCIGSLRISRHQMPNFSHLD